MNAALLQAARDHHRAGRIEEALRAYRELTQDEPANAELWRLRAMAEHQRGDLAAARASIDEAIRQDPAQPASHLISAHLAEDAGDAGIALAAFRRACELKPDWVAAWNGQGTRLLDEGRPREALACFQRAVDLEPQAARGWNNLGMAQLAMERIDEAVRAFDQAVARDPAYALPHFNLARVHELRGDAERAQQAAAHAAKLDPRHAEAQFLLGDIARRKRDFAGAERHYAAAMQLTPAAKAPIALADLYWEVGHVDEARRVYEQALQRHPGAYRAALGSRLILPAVYDSREQLAAIRERYAQGLDELRGMAGQFTWKRPADALAESRWTNFYLAYQGGHDRELQRAFGDLAHAVLSRNAPAWFEPRPRRDTSGRRIRVGFFSYFWFNCTAGRYFSSWVTDLDPQRFETFVYYTNPWVADDTRAIAAKAGVFRHVPGRPLGVLAEQVAADDLDILVYPELGMNAETFTLASLRLAPVQVAGWGHPTTTGLPNVDWFLSSAEMEPEGAADDYTERLALLPGLGTRYARPSDEDPEGTRTDFGLPEDKRLYLVPQSLFKIHPDNDALIAEVLARDPGGIAVLFAAPSDAVTDRFVKRLAPVLAARGIDHRDRVRFMPYMTHGAYLRLNRLCDVMLDTVHWSGGNTSLDAFAAGLPVVTWPGTLMRGRQSLGMLRMLGVEGLAMDSAEAYAARAVEIARDRDLRRHLSEGITAGLERLFDRREPVQAFERFLDQAVRA